MYTHTLGLPECTSLYCVPVLDSSTASKSNDGTGRLDCDSRRAVGPTKTIRGVYMTQLNRLQRLAAFSGLRGYGFYV